MSETKLGFEVRMYKLGTGDCFAIKLHNGKGKEFKMLIDCGAKSGTAKRLNPYVENLLEYLDNKVDALVVTHEHQDHVLGFDKCNKLFDNLKVENMWLAWTEKQDDDQVKEWKDAYGQKKKTLSFLNKEFQKRHSVRNGIRDLKKGKDVSNNIRFGIALNDFTEMHIGENGEYKGDLDGMEYIRKIKSGKTEYLKAGEILRNVDGFDGVNFYILGPPNNWDAVKKEKGKGSEAYSHNKDLEFVNSMSSLSYSDHEDNMPFESKYVQTTTRKKGTVQKRYTDSDNKWRRIDNEWLNSAGNLALRLNRGINNLSVVLAIEFEETGDVLLFPGDAEIGSWNSWHEIDWKSKNCDGDKLTTEDLLNRTIFYKVAHHMSHNGTAKEKGLQMMTHPDLVAMATVDYDVIHSGWKKTMPNRAILNELLKKTKGKLVIMNEKEIFCDKNKTISVTKKRKQLMKKVDKSHTFDETEWYHEYKKVLK